MWLTSLTLRGCSPGAGVAVVRCRSRDGLEVNGINLHPGRDDHGGLGGPNVWCGTYEGAGAMLEICGSARDGAYLPG